jgi:hypothetical protein
MLRDMRGLETIMEIEVLLLSHVSEERHGIAPHQIRKSLPHVHRVAKALYAVARKGCACNPTNQARPPSARCGTRRVRLVRGEGRGVSD